MKVIQKYFLALVPPVEILEKVDEIKIALRDRFGIKYALKSPPHITLKMPFSYNEAKEDQLVAGLEVHLRDQKPFQVQIGGVGTFGNRVIYLSVPKSEQLVHLQQEIGWYCKTQLHLVQELSDRNFHPHMTVAFKDLKASHFPAVESFVSSFSFQTEYSTEELVLLKRKNGSWIPCRSVHF